MAYEMVMPYHLHMPSYFLETFTEYPYINVPIGCAVFRMAIGTLAHCSIKNSFRNSP